MAYFNLTDNTKSAATIHAEDTERAVRYFNNAKEAADLQYYFLSTHLPEIIEVLQNSDHPVDDILLNSYSNDLSIKFNNAKSPKAATAIMSHLVNIGWDPGNGIDSFNKYNSLQATRTFTGHVAFQPHPESIEKYIWIVVRINLNFEDEEEMLDNGCKIIDTGKMSEPKPILEIQCD